ncbi:MAG: TIGR03620 family F420-dependent LLM class oxidoreductase [bacterium]|jgi:probable F420-dependent oxidoreductase|nr:TIGR03620 family F420-dependent LLM class oxidoreductase [bacterium]
MENGTLGVWYAADKLQPAQWLDFVATVERLGYDTQWYSEAMGFESMALGSFLLSHTTRLKMGSSIANIYARDAVASRNGLHTLARISSDRFILGLGVSHIPLVERFRGHAYGRPVATMRDYLEQLRADQSGADTWPVVIAALGPRMLELAAELTRGAIPYNVTPEHTAQARSILGPDKWLVVEQKICLETDTGKALQLARAELSRYMTLPNYRNNWLRLGFSETDLQDGGNERFLNAMVAWGNEATIGARIQEHFDAGATQVCIQPVHPQGDIERAKAILEAFAPAL